jgi:hypothetical protein
MAAFYVFTIPALVSLFVASYNFHGDGGSIRIHFSGTYDKIGN